MPTPAWLDHPRTPPAMRRAPRCTVRLAALLLPWLVACGTVPSAAVEADALVATLQVAEASATAADLDGRILAGTVVVVVDVKPHVREMRVHLDDAGSPLAVDATGPFELVLDTTRLSDGPHVLAVHVTTVQGGGVREVLRASFDVGNTRVAPQPQPDPQPDPQPATQPEAEPGSTR